MFLLRAVVWLLGGVFRVSWFSRVLSGGLAAVLVSGLFAGPVVALPAVGFAVRAAVAVEGPGDGPGLPPVGLEPSFDPADAVDRLGDPLADLPVGDSGVAVGPDDGSWTGVVGVPVVVRVADEAAVLDPGAVVVEEPGGLSDVAPSPGPSEDPVVVGELEVGVDEVGVAVLPAPVDSNAAFVLEVVPPAVVVSDVVESPAPSPSGSPSGLVDPVGGGFALSVVAGEAPWMSAAMKTALTKTAANSGFTAPRIFSNRHGLLTNGRYTLDSPGMAPHVSGATTTGKSQFLYRVNSDKAVLDAAAYADEAGLWVGNKAKVFVEDGPVGVISRTGELTSWINVYRTRTGMVHGAPGSAP